MTTMARTAKPRRPTGEFKPCGVCGRLAGFGRSSVQDHQTKGDQPFQALVTRQIEVQPPSAPYSDFAPLRGRKVLAFSDSRQVAARLAPNLQAYSMRDVIRPLILRGWSDLAALPDRRSAQPGEALSRLHGRRQAARRSAAAGTPRAEASTRLGRSRTAIDRGALQGQVTPTMSSSVDATSRRKSLLRAMYATLTDQYYGCRPLGLASLARTRRPHRRPPRRAPRHRRRRDRRRSASWHSLRLWLAQWATPRGASGSRR